MLTGMFGWKGHLASIITEKANNGSEKDHQDEIDGIAYLRLKTTPQDEDHLKNKKENR